MVINLLPEDLLNQQKRNRQRAAAGSFSGGLLILVIVVLLGLFGFRMFLSRQSNQLNEQLATLRNQVGEKKQVEGTLKAIHLKIDKIKEIFTKNYPYGEILEDLQNRSSDKIEILAVELKNQDQFVVTGKAETLPDLAGYAKNIDDTSTTYESVGLTKIAFDKEDFRYNFSLEFKYQAPVSAEQAVNTQGAQ